MPLSDEPLQPRVPSLLSPLLGLALAAVVAACSGEQEDAAAKTADGSCVPTRQFFEDKVWGGFLADGCAGCHNPQGVARQTQLVLQSASQPGYLDLNLAVLQKLAQVQVQGEPLLLRKARGDLNHGGGVQLKPGSAGYQALAQLIDRFDHPVSCAAPVAKGSALRPKLALLDPKASLRRIALTLLGRLPTDQEQTVVATGGEAALATQVEAMLQDDAFIARVQELWADKLLVGRYLGGNNATNLLDAKDYPQRQWYNDPKLEPDEALRKLGQQTVNDNLAREPLTLMGYVLQQRKPFSEVLTADYVVHDPLTARVYGVTQGFVNAMNPKEFKQIQPPLGERAGLLTSPIFLNRFPTSATNRNRHRSRVVFDLFLATDILKLGDRPIDPTLVTDHTPTLFNADCTVCHTPMEPIAGTFQNWDALGRYRPPELGWFTDMWPPGFGEIKLPADQKHQGLPWLAKQIAGDQRFALAAVQVVAEGLLGRRPLSPPVKGDPGQQAQQLAWQFEQEELTAAAELLRQNKLELRVAVKALVLSPLFRVGGLAAGATPTDRAALAMVGGDRFLTSEELARKLQAVFSTGWTRGDGKAWLTEDLRLLYGGIDGNDVTQRVRAPNGVMLAIARRMANEMACKVTAADFVRAKASRRLFPLVEHTYAPEDANGFAIQAAQAAIRQNIQFLHERLLGEVLPAGDDELERTWTLFYQTWKEGSEALRNGEQPAGTGEYLHSPCRAVKHPDTGAALDSKAKLERDPNYVLRAWMAVLAYLMEDAKFLHQ